MIITKQDEGAASRKPTISRNTSLGREFHRSATWEDEGVTTTVTAVAFVSGIRCRKHADGSWDMLGEYTRFDTLFKDEFVQHVERAAFIWDRTRTAWDGTTSSETAMDYSNEVGLHYQPTLEAAEEQCRIFIENLDFERNFDPAAWK